MGNEAMRERTRGHPNTGSGPGGFTPRSPVGYAKRQRTTLPTPPEPARFAPEYGLYDPADPGTFWDSPRIPPEQRRQEAAEARGRMRHYRATISGYHIRVSAQYIPGGIHHHGTTLWRWNCDGRRVDDYAQVDQGDTRDQAPHFERIFDFADAPQRPSAAA